MGNRHGLEIRAAQATDAPGLAELLTASGQPVQARALAERIEALRHRSASALVAIEWGPPSGVVVMHWYGTLDHEAATAQITTLLVGRDERRRGIGRLLLKAASQAARAAGCDRLQILVEPEQPELSAFCAAAGFVDAGPHLVRPLRKKSQGNDSDGLPPSPG